MGRVWGEPAQLAGAGMEVMPASLHGQGEPRTALLRRQGKASSLTAAAQQAPSTWGCQRPLPDRGWAAEEDW